MQNKVLLYATALKDALLGVQGKKQRERVVNFKKLLKKRGDLKLLGRILQEFSRQWQARKGVVAELTSAKPLAGEMKKRVLRSLKKRGLALKEKIDPVVIGGVKLVVGNRYCIDNTMKGRVEKLRNTIVVQ